MVAAALCWDFIEWTIKGAEIAVAHFIRYQEDIMQTSGLYCGYISDLSGDLLRYPERLFIGSFIISSSISAEIRWVTPVFFII